MKGKREAVREQVSKARDNRPDKPGVSQAKRRGQAGTKGNKCKKGNSKRKGKREAVKEQVSKARDDWPDKPGVRQITQS